MKSVLLTIFLVFLSGCTLAPSYERPPAPVPAEWPKGEAYSNADQERPVHGEFTCDAFNLQDFITDSRLQQVIRLSLQNSRDLRLAALNVEKARALYGISRAELFPVIDASGSWSKQHIPASVMGFPESLTVERYDVSLGIAAWEIDFFGRIRSLEEKALEEYLATEEARRSAQIALISEVARAYYTIAADRENLELARSTLKTQQGIYMLIKRQYDVGIANELVLKRTQTQVDTARRAVARYAASVARDQNALNLLAGTPVPEELLPADLTGVKPPRDISPGLSSDVLLKRPDIMAAEHQLKAAYAFIGAARASFFPRISLTTAIGTASEDLSGLFTGGSEAWNFAPGIVVPIFDARTWAAYRVSKAEQKIALTRYEKTIQTAFREVSDTLAVKGTIDQRVSAQQSLVEAVDRTYALSTVRYEKGIDSYLSVHDAQRSLFVAKQGLIELRLIKLANRIRLFEVLGGGETERNNKQEE